MDRIELDKKALLTIVAAILWSGQMDSFHEDPPAGLESEIKTVVMQADMLLRETEKAMYRRQKEAAAKRGIKLEDE